MLLSVTSSFTQNKKPNIIYILSDDLGYGDLGCYGQKEIKTPHLDALAAGGMKFTRHYAGATVCAPSRAVLMTGRAPGKVRVRGNYETGPHGFGAGLELKDEDITLAEVMKQYGYSTAMIGKWGMGVENTTGEPNKQGFDYSFGFLNQGHAHSQYPDYLFRDGKRVEIEENEYGRRDAYTNDLFTDEAISYINSHREKPFFLYLAYTTPHAELLVPEDSIFLSYKGRFKEKPFIENGQGSNGENDFGIYHSQENPNAAYAASVSHQDMSIGRIIALVKERGLFENTVIMFSSDNGPAREGGADPEYFNSSGGLRGGKRDLYEGGIRMPFIVSWPAKIKPGQVTDHVSAFWDIIPTFAGIAGEKLSRNIPTEGISFYPTLIGKPQKQKQHAYLYWEFHEKPTSTQALLFNDWKAIRHDPNGPFEIYNLKHDSAEKINVAEQHPQVVNKALQLFTVARTPHELWPLKTTININGTK